MHRIPAALRADMKSKDIDIPLSIRVLEDLNKSLAAGSLGPKVRSLPSLSDPRIVQLETPEQDEEKPSILVETESAAARLAAFGLKLPKDRRTGEGQGSKNSTTLTKSQLTAIGKALLPFTAYGVLNGGSATSYADEKKNLSLGQSVFEAVQDQFELLAPACRGRPKGSAPAFINPDGSPGPSFLELKMRHRLLAALESRGRTGGGESNKQAPAKEFLPLYQMTSHATHEALAADYRKAEESDYISLLASTLAVEPARWKSGIQSLICAYTHSSQGEPRKIFDRAFGREQSSLPLPGGHGQCFRVLKDVFVQLRDQGIRYAYLGNVDNLGYTVDPAELAVMALRGSAAGFEFALRSSLDLKGGVLAEDEQGRWTVADIGPAISFKDFLALEKSAGFSLFNCATGIFDLDYLVPRIDEIADRLPLRLSDQDKDAGRYSQIEQVTWEVMGLMDDVTVFSVEKSRRFLAAKLLVDTLLTSGLGLDDPRMPEDIKKIAASLHRGLLRLLRTVYGLELSCGRWLPKELL